VRKAAKRYLNSRGRVTASRASVFRAGAEDEANVQEDDAATLELRLRHIVGFRCLQKRSPGFDFGRGNFQHFRSGADAQAMSLFSSSTTRMRFCCRASGSAAETFAKVRHRIISAKGLYAFDEVPARWNGGDSRDADNFPAARDADARGLLDFESRTIWSSFSIEGSPPPGTVSVRRIRVRRMRDAA